MPVTTDIDTGVAVIPAARPSVFSPLAFVSGMLINRPLDTADSGTGTNAAPIANNFDDVLNVPVVANPGY